MKIQNNINLFAKNYSRDKITKGNNKNQPKSISASVYNSTCPVGANYYIPSFGLRNPEKALKRAEMLKDKYAQKGVSYLLPNETWSDKRLFKTLERVGNKFDELAKNNDLSAKTLNGVLSVVLPVAIADKIKVKNFSELGMDLHRDGFSREHVLSILGTYGGLTRSNKDESSIYLPIERDSKTFEGKLNLKSTFLHEFKHALTNKCTNIFASDNYGRKALEQKTMLDETMFYNDMFMQFEQIFQTLADGCPVKLNKHFLVNTATNTKTDRVYDSEEDILDDMDKEIKTIIKDKINETKTGKYAIVKLLDYGYIDEKSLKNLVPNLVLTDEAMDKICQNNPKSTKQIKNIVKQYMLPDDAFTSKTFWQFMQHRAMDERQAYTTDKELREVYGSKKQPVDYELQSLMYGEMEKFFRTKVKNS
ncbi:hypothetical protein IJ732_04005 [bacterium]|nr:hypothetical protein [bacterium]